MKNHELRKQALERELERRQKDPVATLYGFLCQAEKLGWFNSPDPRKVEKAQVLYRKFMEEAGFVDSVGGALGNLTSMRHLKHLLAINRGEIRAIRAGLDLLRPRAA